MVRKLLLVLFIFPSICYAQRGDQIFEAMRCGGCHSKSFDSFAPSLKVISKSYFNQKEELKKYLQGKRKGLIKGDPKTMKAYIKLTSQLKESELESLANYLLSH